MTAILFLAFWVIVGLVVFFIAVRGGPRGARESLYQQSRRGGKVAFVVFLVVYVAFGVAVPTLVLAGNDESKQIAAEGITLTKDEESGRELFGVYCNQCHTLKAADTVGRVGPNLDELRPTYAIVASAVTNGRKRGNGTMPAGLVQGADVRDVACFVDRATHPNPKDKPPKQCAIPTPSSGSGGKAGPNSTGSGQNNPNNAQEPGGGD